LIGPLEDSEFAVGFAGEDGGVETEQLATPPVAGGAFLFKGGEPVLPEDGFDVARRSDWERIGAEEGQDVGVAFEESFFGEGDDFSLLDVGERGEPQVPVEAGLIGRVDAGRFVQGLGFVAEESLEPWNSIS
jgi:hypothetical protein